MEYLDITDKNGNKTGEKKLRKHVHRDGDFHRAVDVWILNSKNELLIQKRSASKDSYPSMWEVSCSGHISAGDEPLLSAVRELKEELGLRVKANDLKYLFGIQENYITNNGTFINNEIKDVYLFKKDVLLSDIFLQKEEVEEVKFIHFLELEKLINKKDKTFVPHKKEYKKLFALLKHVLKKAF